MTEFQLHKILQDIKPIRFITQNYEVDILQVSKFYDVTYKAISTIIDRNRYELENDGMTVCNGEKLKEIKIKNENIDKKASTLTLLNPLVVCRLAFYLTESDTTIQVKNKILKTDINLYSFLSRRENTLVKKYEKEMDYLLVNLIGKYHEIKQQISCGSFKIDFLIDDYLAIEVDEHGHSSYDKSNEIIRENFIKASGYKLFRYDTRNNNMLEFLGDVVHELNNKIEGAC